MKTVPAALLSALLCVAAAPCQNDPATITATTTSTTSASGDFAFEAGSHDVHALVDSVAAYLDYNILYSSSELTSLGKIRITRRTEVDSEGCWAMFGALLYHKGLAILALDQAAGLYEVISMNGPRSQEVTASATFVPYGEIESYANQKATPILTSVPLQNINATIATNALRPFFASNSRSAGITIGNVGNNTDMLLQGFGPQVVTACRLLKLVDVGDNSSRPEIVVVRLRHAAPEDLVARIDDVLGMNAKQAQAQMQGVMLTGTPLRAVAHPALNAVILSGAGAQIRDALALIDKLDDRSSSSQVAVVKLRHVAAENLAARLGAVFSMHAGPSQMRGGMVVAPLRAVAHQELEAVILRGTEAQIREAQDLIVKLDVPAVETDVGVLDDLEQRVKQFELRIKKLDQALRAGR